MVVVALRILNIWILLFCLLSGQSEIVVLVIVFNLWFGPGFIFESSS